MCESSEEDVLKSKLVAELFCVVENKNVLASVTCRSHSMVCFNLNYKTRNTRIQNKRYVHVFHHHAGQNHNLNLSVPNSSFVNVTAFL
jgi:hypothetical protein